MREEKVYLETQFSMLENPSWSAKVRYRLKTDRKIMTLSTSS